MNAPTDDELYALAARVGEHLSRSNRRFVSAESCTGGWIGKVATDVPGSSIFYEGGAIVYSNELKQRSVDVCSSSLDRCGAVSEQTVKEMARGALLRLGGDIAVAVSGIAGPGGGSADKPIGTVWFGWAQWRNGMIEVSTEKQLFHGDREAVRRLTVGYALTRILAF